MKFSPQHLPFFIFRTRRRRRRRRRKNELPVSYGFARPSLYFLWKQRKRYIKAHDNCPCITSANSYSHDLLNRHYRTFSPSRVRGYIKVPFFQFRYLNLLIISHGWDVANQNQNPVILSFFRQTNQILTFISAAGDLMTKLYYIVHQNPPKILSLKISSVKGKDHSYVQ